ncbi:hypothetical protein IFR05_013152 [Cadophora sp. M221]|nr:hypothetical protein IFR05_013152 [Cadophora sp. M221]
MGVTNLGHQADPVLTRLVDEDKVPWYKKRNLRLLYLMLYPTCLGIEITSGYDSQLINGAQFIPSWNKYFGSLTIDGSGKENYQVTGPLLGILSCAYNLGSIMAVPIVPIISEKFGRRKSIAFGSSCMIVGAFLQGFSQNAAMYVVARMLLGYGIIPAVVSASAMLGELSHPKERAVMTSLFNASWFVGSLIAAGIVVRTSQIDNSWGWRIPSCLQAVPSLIQIIIIFLIPESPRWLITKDRREEAYEILVKYHSEGDRDSLFAKAEMAQIEATMKLEMESGKQSWIGMFSEKGMRRRTFIAMAMGVFTQFSGNTLIAFYLSKILAMIGYTDSWTKTRINLGNSCWSFLNGTIIALVAPRFPRRKMFLLCASSMLICYIAWTISMKYAMTAYNTNVPNPAAAISVLVFIFLYSPCYNIGNNALVYTYLVELFPFHQRSHGISIEQLLSRIAGTFSTFVNPIGMDDIGWKYLIVFNIAICLELLVIYFFYPETQGRTLEELAFLFEDREFEDKATHMVEKAINSDAMDAVLDTDVQHIEVPRKEA